MHIWDRDTEQSKFTNIYNQYLFGESYFTFCGVWEEDMNTIHPDDAREIEVTCDYCMLLHFEREAKNESRENSQVSVAS